MGPGSKTKRVAAGSVDRSTRGVALMQERVAREVDGHRRSRPARRVGHSMVASAPTLVTKVRSPPARRWRPRCPPLRTEPWPRRCVVTHRLLGDGGEGSQSGRRTRIEASPRRRGGRHDVEPPPAKELAVDQAVRTAATVTQVDKKRTTSTTTLSTRIVTTRRFARNRFAVAGDVAPSRPVRDRSRAPRSLARPEERRCTRLFRDPTIAPGQEPRWYRCHRRGTRLRDRPTTARR